MRNADLLQRTDLYQKVDVKNSDVTEVTKTDCTNRYIMS